MKSQKLFLGLTGSIASIKLPELLLEADENEIETIWHASGRAKPFVLQSFLRYLSRVTARGEKDGFGEMKLVQEEAEAILERSLTNDVKLEPLFLAYQKARNSITEEFRDNYVVRSLDLMAHQYEEGIDREGIIKKEKGHVKHINIAESVDAVLIAPTTANTLSKVVHGFTDNFLLEVVRAIPVSKRVYLALAMNTEMLHDPAIQRNVKTLQSPDFSKKYTIIPSITKQLQCGTTGDGAMEEVAEIFKVIQKTV